MVNAMTLKQLQNLPPQVVGAIVSSRGADTAGLPAEAAQYVWQLSRAYALFTAPDSDGSMLSAAEQLQREFPSISLATARRRVSESVTYMQQPVDNTPEEWYTFYADRMDRLGVQCERAGKWEDARLAYAQALDYRVRAAAGRVDPERIRYRRLLVSPDLQAERLGLDGTGVRELLRRGRQLIEQTALSPKDKERVMHDLELETGIEDVEEVEEV